MPGFVTETAFFVLRPSNIIIVCLVGGLILLVAGRRRGGIGLVAVGTFGIVVLGFFPIGKMALGVLEDRFPRPDPAAVAPAGILVLGGAIDPHVTAARGETALNEASERIIATAALARRYPQARVLVSGGPERHPSGAVIGAPLVAELLTAFGVEEARIELEPRSQNTWENATFSKAVAQPGAGETWLVVTSAWHMPRAIGALRAAGWEAPMAWPVDYRSAGEGLADVSPASGDGLQHANLAAREGLGLLAYWLTGRSTALFPAPASATGSRPRGGNGGSSGVYGAWIGRSPGRWRRTCRRADMLESATGDTGFMCCRSVKGANSCDIPARPVKKSRAASDDRPRALFAWQP